MTEKDKMLQGKLYMASDKELKRMYLDSMNLTRSYNLTEHSEEEKRQSLLKKLFGSVGKGVTIIPPFRCDYGKNIYIGNQFFANYDCIILDVCKVEIGDRVMFGPRVCLYTAAHPIDALVRASGLEYGKEIHICDDVWIGGNSVISGGVTIGARSIIGSGSIVTKDIPSDVIAAGNPCRVIRKITENDREEWVKKAQKH